MSSPAAPSPPPRSPGPTGSTASSAAGGKVVGGGEGANGAGAAMSGAGLPKTYVPSDHEPRITAKWDGSSAFHADPSRVVRGEAEPYCIFIPPPNVTAALHLGHALNNTLQDVLIRAHRMMGYETLWLPGTDHAGIATQAVVEKRVLKEEGKRRQQFTREEFVAKIQAFKDEYEATITQQLKDMGCSCDWARQRFTMDEQCAAAVREAFFQLFKDGLIYRGKRLVNWDPALQTAVADDECYDEEIESGFWYLRYPLVGGGGGGGEGDGAAARPSPQPVSWGELARLGYPGAEGEPAENQAWVTVATTRPETYLGDTAVAVNPRDPRARALRGLSAQLPLVGRIIPIVEDSYVVLPAAMQEDPEEAKKDPKAAYATGFLKVTPAHDPNDWEIGQRHNLEAINVMAPDATISDKHGWSDADEIKGAHIFIGKKREEARKLVVKEFEARGLLEAVKPYRHSVKHSDRSKAIVEPYLSDQWYVKVTDPRFAASANAALAPEQRSAECGPAECGPGVPPGGGRAHSARSTPMPVGQELGVYVRHLPHFQRGGSTYLVTFRVMEGELSPAERQIVLDACTHWHEDRMTVHAAVVMPDHVHMLIFPLQKAPGAWWSLGELMHSIKSFSAHKIAKLRGRPGPIWQDEWHDRIVRSGGFAEALRYLELNPVRAGLVERSGEYPFLVLPLTSPESKDAPFGVPALMAERAREEAAHGESAAGRDARPTSPPTLSEPALRFYPARYAKTYEQWHDNIRDWCISRQLWWGHRIPVWSKKLDPITMTEGAEPIHKESQGTLPTKFHFLSDDENEQVWVHTDDVAGDGTRMEHVCVRPGFPNIEEKLANHHRQQDPDVLDTWFSSALWPLSTLGWPDPEKYNAENNRDALAAFNPSSVLCTAREIITLWVSRMVMFNRYFAGSGQGAGPVPFGDVFIHAMIQDGEGRKMSKTLGNGVDPRDIIASHGADAMRFTLVQMTTNTQDVRMPVKKDSRTGKNTSEKFDGGRNYCNKLWNTARFVLEKLSRAATERSGQSPDGRAIRARELGLLDRWMMSRLAATVKSIDASLAAYEFSDYAESMYKLLWWDLCDWYLEGVKPTVEQNRVQQAVLAHALETIVRLLHPIAPFITEAIWEHVKQVETPPIEGVTLGASRKNGLLCTAGWPRIDESWIDLEAEAEFERVRELIGAIRNVRSEHQVSPKRKVTLHASAAAAVAMKSVPGLVETLAGLERVEQSVPGESSGAVAFRALGDEMHLSNLVDAGSAIDSGAERERLSKQIESLRKTEATIAGRLSNPGYLERAPAKLVEESKAQLAATREEITALEAKIKALS